MKLASVQMRNGCDNLLADLSALTNVFSNSSEMNENMMSVDASRNKNEVELDKSYPHVNANAADENGDVNNDVAVAITTESTLNPRKNRRCANHPSCLRLAKECKGCIPSTCMFVPAGNMTVIDRAANDSIKKQHKKEADRLRQLQKRASR